MIWKDIKGLTLIELLAVVLIVGILAAIAIPTYTNYMVRARRADAKTALEQLRASQEAFRAEHGRYANDGEHGNALLILQNTWGVPSNPVGDYVIKLNSTSPTSYIAEAEPNTSRQLKDGSLFIDQDGKKWPAEKWAK